MAIIRCHDYILLFQRLIYFNVIGFEFILNYQNCLLIFVSLVDIKCVIITDMIHDYTFYSAFLFIAFFKLRLKNKN